MTGLLSGSSHDRRGVSLVEVLFALILFATLIIPLLAMQRPRDVAVDPRSSRSTYLMRETIDLAMALPRRDLQEIVKKGKEAPNGYREIDPLALRTRDPSTPSSIDDALRRAVVEELEARLYVRENPHVYGRFGFDRFDFVLEFDDSRTTKYMSRSVVKSNRPELVALGEMRLFTNVEQMPLEELRESIRDLVKANSQQTLALGLEGSSMVVPLYPRILDRFEPPPSDPAELERKLDLYESLVEGDPITGVDFLSNPEFSTPRFNKKSVCN